MPRKRVRPKRRRLIESKGMTLCQLVHLFRGNIFDFCFDCNAQCKYYGNEYIHGSCYPFEDEAEREELYNKNRDYILNFVGEESDWDKAGCLFCFRPRSWWKYDFPKLGIPYPGDNVYTQVNCHIEENYKFLKRYNLLLPGEEEGHFRQIEGKKVPMQAVPVRKEKQKEEKKSEKIVNIADFNNND